MVILPTLLQLLHSFVHLVHRVSQTEYLVLQLGFRGSLYSSRSFPCRACFRPTLFSRKAIFFALNASKGMVATIFYALTQLVATWRESWYLPSMFPIATSLALHSSFPPCARHFRRRRIRFHPRRNSSATFSWTGNARGASFAGKAGCRKAGNDFCNRAA